MRPLSQYPSALLSSQKRPSTSNILIRTRETIRTYSITNAEDLAKTSCTITMQIIKILQATLLVASQAHATPILESAPTPNAAVELLKRADPAPVICGRKHELSLQI